MTKLLMEAAEDAAVSVMANPSGTSHPGTAPSHLYVAIAVCGPGEMVSAVIAAAQALTAGGKGYHPTSCPSMAVSYHVHRETFIM